MYAKLLQVQCRCGNACFMKSDHMMPAKARVSSVVQIHKSYLLKYITRLEAFPSEQDGSAFVELHLSNTTFTSETRKAFQVPAASLIEVVGSIYLLCK